jgi:cytochrome b561
MAGDPDRMARVASGYTRTAIALHWLVAVLILVAFALGLYMVELKLSPTKLKLYSWHKWLGVTIWLLVVVRLVWRARHRPPALPAMPKWQHTASQVTHGLLYVLLLAIPITGWMFSSASGFPVVYLGVSALQLPDLVGKDKALAEVLQAVHSTLNWTLFAIVLLHVAAALKHHVVDRDTVLHRMLPLLPEPRHKP